MFQTNVPVTADAFRDRATQLARLAELVKRLETGHPTWLAILGPRKMGKSSLIWEAARRHEGGRVDVVIADVMESQPVSMDFFRLLAARLLDAAFGAELGARLERLLALPARFRDALDASVTFRQLPSDIRVRVLALPESRVDADMARFIADLPEQIATSLGRRVLVAIDEFQELAALSGPHGFDPFPLLRATWQRHTRTAYVISGSSRSMLTELVSSEASPFFQHFDLMDLPPFSREDSIDLLVSASPAGRRINPELAARVYDAVGGHPFYLQLCGEAVTAFPPPYDEAVVKQALQGLLFARTGRLALYFEGEFQRAVGRSTLLAATLSAAATGPLRIADLAERIRAPSGETVRYVERLGDLVERQPDGRYAVPDSVFAAWLRWRSPQGAAVPMRVLGDEAELAVAEQLAELGFDLVYQSRGSRGAFDLLATRGILQLGVQVKRATMPLTFPKRQWDRMAADARKWRWRWTIAVVDGANRVTFLDPARTRGRRLTEKARIESLPAWLDTSRTSSRKVSGKQQRSRSPH